MPKVRDPNREQAFLIYKQYDGKIDLVEIASQLNLPDGTIRGWKSKDKWEQQLNGTLQKNTERSKRNRGGQPGNKNAVGNDGGAPPENKNAEKFGFFSKFLPPETKEIFDAVAHANPLDLLWHQIQLAYAAIVRAQQIAYVKDQADMSKTKIQQKDGDTVTEERWEVQFAWDKQANFMQAQARAQGELRSMIKQYDELLHNNWELATEEQKQRIAVMKAQSAKLSGSDNKDELQKLDEVLAQIKGVI
jgi:uncharacterized protein YjcR